jgi:hypothetical protein
LELARLDKLQASIYKDATQGKATAIRLSLDISAQRCRLLGLFPKDGQTVNIGIIGKPDAEQCVSASWCQPLSNRPSRRPSTFRPTPMTASP